MQDARDAEGKVEVGGPEARLAVRGRGGDSGLNYGGQLLKRRVGRVTK